MTGPTCPRCGRASLAPETYCGGCGAPLLLREDATPTLLDVPLELDRRRRPSGEGGEAEARAGALAELERSRRQLGPAVPPDGEPAPAGPLADARGASGAPGRAPADPPPAPGGSLEIRVTRAPSHRRAAAWLVDAGPFLAAAAVLGRSLIGAAGPGGGSGLFDLAGREQTIVLSLAATLAVALATYATLAHALAGATLGKWLFGLRLVGPDGARPSPARSAARSLLALASGALLGLGFLLALFTRSGRAMHDLLARTWVVKAP